MPEEFIENVISEPAQRYNPRKDVQGAVIKQKARETSKPRKKSDEFLKDAFKDNFPDFLHFVYPDADKVIDFSKAIDFMDKELFAIIPDRERKRDGREADLLARLHLLDGSEKWVLLNVEIEGSNDAEFSYRLFQYNYRIRDRYGVSVATIAVFTGSQNQVRQTVYQDDLLGTVLFFKYRSYHIFDDSKETLLAKRNPFALIVLACQKAILEGKIPDEELGEERLTIAKALLTHGYDHERIISFIIFLKNFIFIDNEEINSKFDQLMHEIAGETMSSYVLERFKRQEREEGRLEERAKALEEKRDIARNLKNKGIDLNIIAEATGLSIEDIESL